MWVTGIIYGLFSTMSPFSYYWEIKKNSLRKIFKIPTDLVWNLSYTLCQVLWFCITTFHRVKLKTHAHTYNVVSNTNFVTKYFETYIDSVNHKFWYKILLQNALFAQMSILKTQSTVFISKPVNSFQHNTTIVQSCWWVQSGQYTIILQSETTDLNCNNYH